MEFIRLILLFCWFQRLFIVRTLFREKTEGALGKTLLMTIPLFLVGYFITWAGFRYMISDPNVSEEEMELFFTYCSPNVLLMTAAVFLLVRKVRITSPVICRALANLTKCGFGLYCVHYFCRSFLYVRTVDRDTCSGVGSCFGCSYLYLFMVIYLSGE